MLWLVWLEQGKTVAILIPTTNIDWLDLGCHWLENDYSVTQASTLRSDLVGVTPCRKPKPSIPWSK
jgi:hypothetical protein